MTKRIGIAAVFLVGCAVGGASSQLVVPKASAQQAATLTKWEYHCTTDFPMNSDYAVKEATKLGAEGWEALTVHNDFRWCFKRPKM
jgi:hypothetical protein